MAAHRGNFPKYLFLVPLPRAAPFLGQEVVQVRGY